MDSTTQRLHCECSRVLRKVERDSQSDALRLLYRLGRQSRWDPTLRQSSRRQVEELKHLYNVCSSAHVAMTWTNY